MHTLHHLQQRSCVNTCRIEKNVVENVNIFPTRMTKIRLSCWPGPSIWDFPHVQTFPEAVANPLHSDGSFCSRPHHSSPPCGSPRSNKHILRIHTVSLWSLTNEFDQWPIHTTPFQTSCWWISVYHQYWHASFWINPFEIAVNVNLKLKSSPTWSMISSTKAVTRITRTTRLGLKQLEATRRKSEELGGHRPKPIKLDRTIETHYKNGSVSWTMC